MDIKQYITPLLKWWWLILASTMVATLSSLYAVNQQPPIYQARSTLMLGQAINNPNPTGMEFYLGQQLAQTYSDMAQRDPVKVGTMEALGLTWLPEYTVGIVPNTLLIELKVTDSDPERAAAIANELANQVVLRSPTIAQEEEDQGRQSFIKDQLDDLETQIEATNDEIEAKQAELADLFSARQIADTQTQIQALETKLTSLQSNYASLLASSQQGAINTLSIFESANVPLNPIGPNQLSTVLTAAAIGFVLGAGAAYILEYLDDTVKTPDDVQQLVDLPTLSGIAKYPTNGGEKYNLISQEQPRSPVSEAYRGLRTAIMFSNIDKPARNIVVSSPNPGEGKSLTVANLGTVFAQAGHRTLIIDGDLRRPVQHKIFEIPNKNFGLTNMLLQMILDGEYNETALDIFDLLEGTIHETQQKDLFVLTSGSLPPNPAELVGSEKMKKLLEVLSDNFDLVIVDSPPILAVTDAVVLSARADGVVLISNSGETRRNQLEQAVAKLMEVNANLIGVILNRLSAKTGGYYYYYYYGRTYYHDESNTDGNIDGENKRLKRKRGSRKDGKRRWVPNLFARSKG